jgi:hypothetical protein
LETDQLGADFEVLGIVKRLVVLGGKSAEESKNQPRFHFNFAPQQALGYAPALSVGLVHSNHLA